MYVYLLIPKANFSAFLVFDRLRNIFYFGLNLVVKLQDRIVCLCANLLKRKKKILYLVLLVHPADT